MPESEPTDPPAHLSDGAQQAWRELVTGRERPADLVALEAAAVQVARMRDAQRRIDDEGLIVPDAKGEPIAHPALVVERAAQAEVRKWAEQRKPRPVR